jgi:fatty acid desaturase
LVREFSAVAGEHADHSTFRRRVAQVAGPLPDSVCFPQEGQKNRVNRKELAVLLIIAVLLLALILFGAGFAVHVLWWIALIVLALWLLGFLFRAAEGAGPRRRWYRW